MSHLCTNKKRVLKSHFTSANLQNSSIFTTEKCSMDTSLQEKLKSLIFKYTYKKHITLETSINKDLCIEGDDAIDFPNEFATLFQVDITQFSFDEYFYNEGELL